MKLPLKLPDAALAERLSQCAAAAAKWSLEQLAALQAAAAKWLAKALRPPSSLEDYVKIGDLYIAKRLLLRLACLLGALAFLAVFYLLPYLERQLWTPTLVIDSAKYRTYSGAAEVVDHSGRLLYRGQLQDGFAKGRGALYDSGKLLYEGNFADNRYEGRGVLYKNGARVYEGAFKDNCRAGRGVEYYESGRRKYQGHFANDLYEGDGAVYADDESSALVYQGAFSGGAYSGPGKLFAGGKLRYAGEFAGGVFSGEGRLYDTQQRLLYEGSFTDGKFSGSGKQYAASGRLFYEGGFAGGRYEGSGRLYDSKSGRLLYEGGFSGGLYSGEGTLYSAAGRAVYKGRFFGGTIDFAALLDSSLERIREIFGREDTLEMRENDFLLLYRRSKLAFAFRFAQNGAQPALQRILFGGSQAVGPVKNGLTVPALTRALDPTQAAAEPAALTGAQQSLLRLLGKDAAAPLYRLRWQDADVAYAAYAAAPEGVILFFEMEGIE